MKAELGPTSWDADVLNWMARARRGAGQVGPFDSRTAYFWQEPSWGGPLARSCGTPRPDAGGKGDKGGGGGGGGGKHQRPPKPR